MPDGSKFSTYVFLEGDFRAILVVVVLMLLLAGGNL